jgi:hypothetical protein
VTNYVLFTMHLGNLCNENQLDSLFILNLFRQIISTCSGIFIAHHQEVFTEHVQQLVRVTYPYNMYLFLYIYSEYLLMMGNKQPETCRGCLTK